MGQERASGALLGADKASRAPRVATAVLGVAG